MKFRSLLFVFSPVALVLSLIAMVYLSKNIDEWRYPTTTQFESARWQTDQKYLYSVLNRVHTGIIQSGMTQQQVKTLLGKPNSKPKAMVWEYDTSQPGWHFSDFEGVLLAIEFDSNQQVRKTEIVHWRD